MGVCECGSEGRGIVEVRRNVIEDTSVSLPSLSLQYKYNNILDHFCFPGASVVLSQPNDGMAEVDKTNLPYGTSVEHAVGECHSVLMRWPPQCKNDKRNREINSAAAR